MRKIVTSLFAIGAACSLAACESANKEPAAANLSDNALVNAIVPDAQTGTVERTGPQEQTGTVERTGPEEQTGTVERTAPEEQTGTVERTTPAEK